MHSLNEIFELAGFQVSRNRYPQRYKDLYRTFKEYTMTPEASFYENLFLAEHYISRLQGDVAECGVWRGGMIAALANVLGKERKYYLFDSFEGLPDPQEKDGIAAINWQIEKNPTNYFDNCNAEVDIAVKAMTMTMSDFEIKKGWFNETMSTFCASRKLALLRLDGDWYDSIKTSLQYLYPQVVSGGLVIIDDYFAWDGCSRALHDYLSETKSLSRIRTSHNDIAYIVKAD